jgi:hypothetical protein
MEPVPREWDQASGENEYEGENGSLSVRLRNLTYLSGAEELNDEVRSIIKWGPCEPRFFSQRAIQRFSWWFSDSA